MGLERLWVSLSDRERKIIQKKIECEERINHLYQQFPRLKEISQLLAQIALDLAFMKLGQSKLGMTEEELYQAKESLLMEKKKILKEHKVPLNIEEVWWDCPQCKDTGFININQKCQCLIQKNINNIYSKSGLTKEQYHQRFDTFELHWYENFNKMKKIFQMSVDTAEAVINNKRVNNLLFCGGVGLGKTHLCSAIANYCINGGKTVIYKRVGDLLDIIREYKFKFDSEQNKLHNELKYLSEVDVLILDDLGSENLTDFGREQIFKLLDERNNDYKPWIISTNLHPEEIEATYGERIADRILGTVTILPFQGKSIRLKMNRMRQEELAKVCD